jgi:hypothetical protein
LRPRIPLLAMFFCLVGIAGRNQTTTFSNHYSLGCDIRGRKFTCLASGA